MAADANPISLFPLREQLRVDVQAKRYVLAMEDAESLAELWRSEAVSEERAARMGRLDTARNALVSIGRQVSTPGHYSRIPTVAGGNADRLAAILMPHWLLSQHAEYLSYTCGSCAHLVERDEAGVVRFRVVPAHELWADTHPDDPTVITRMCRLRMRPVRLRTGDEEMTPCWDVWDVRDPQRPTFGIHVAEADGELGEELTAQFAPVEGYPWMVDDVPYVPWVVRRQWDTGDLWCWQRGRSVARGTLQAFLLHTLAHHAALNSTGKVACMVNLRPASRQSASSLAGGAESVLDVGPGDFLQLELIEPTQGGTVVEVGEVDTLAALAQYAAEYSAAIAEDMGINSGEAQRTGANPASGAALYISQASKREEQRRALPFCQRTDLEVARIAGALAGVPADGISVSYHEIPLSAEEQRQERERDEWLVAQGYRSRVDIMLDRHPGWTRDQAIAELRRIRAEEALLVEPVVGAPAPAATSPMQNLNGAQITAVLQVLGNMQGGAIGRDGAITMIELVGVPRAQAELIADSATRARAAIPEGAGAGAAGVGG